MLKEHEFGHHRANRARVRKLRVRAGVIISVGSNCELPTVLNRREQSEPEFT